MGLKLIVGDQLTTTPQPVHWHITDVQSLDKLVGHYKRKDIFDDYDHSLCPPMLTYQDNFIVSLLQKIFI